MEKRNLKNHNSSKMKYKESELFIKKKLRSMNAKRAILRQLLIIQSK